MKLNFYGTLLLMCILLVGCSKPKAPVYGGVEHIRVNSLGVGESAISADLAYYNPNAFRLSLKEGQMDVFLNNRFLGKTVLDTATSIPALDSFFIPVSMKVDMKQVYSNALDILLNKQVTIRLDGSARVGRGGVYFTLPIKYEGVQELDIRF